MSSKNGNLYKFGEFRFDGEMNRLWQNESLILLSPKATELLKLLLERDGEFISKQEIFDSVWAETFVEDGVLTQNIYTLRKSLGKNSDGQPLIENKTRLGYRITIPVEVTEKSTGDFKPASYKTNENLAALPSPADEKNIVEDLLPSASTKTKVWKNYPTVLIGGLVVLAIAGFFGYRFFASQTERFSDAEIAKFRFQRVTDTGDASFPALSPDGNFVAYSKRDDAIYVKDLQTQTESKMEIENVKKFGVLQFSKDSNFLYVRDSASFSQGANIMKVSRFGGKAELVAENVWSGFSLAPDEKQIAFVRSFPQENRQSVIVKKIGGEERELFALTAPQEFYLRAIPSWSADGKKLVFAINKPNQDFLKFVVADTRSGQAEDIFAENFKSVSQIVWHPKRNTLIAAAREGKNSQLWEIGYPSGKIQRLTNDLSSYLSPRISDDGTKLLITEGVHFSNLRVFDKENESLQKQLTFGKSNSNGSSGIAYFSGGEIVYSSNEGDSYDTNLWRINPNNNERKQLTINAGSRNDNPTVSPDDKFIYFNSNRGGKLNVWRIDANGENPTQITSVENTTNAFPQISPDGNWLYFIRNADKSSAVWRKSLIDNREEKLSDEKIFAPTNFLLLSPDGKYLLFQNLSEKPNGENAGRNFQIAVVETNNFQKAKSFNLSGRQVGVSWTSDSRAFYYVMPKPDKDEIWSRSLEDNTEPQIFRTIVKETVFNSVSSKDGRTFAVAGGQISYDPILITNFE